jgi:trehalose/maltose hydrolase-like predicted phosphorylase
MTDEFETAGEEKIISLFNPVGVSITPALDIDQAKPYSQILDMKTGLLKTHFVSKSGVDVEVETVIGQGTSVAGERWTLHGAPNAEYSVLANCSDVGVPKSKDPKEGTWKLMPNHALVRIAHGTTAVKAQWELVRTGVRMNGFADSKGELTFTRTLHFSSAKHRTDIEKARLAAGGRQGIFPDVDEWPLRKSVRGADPEFDALLGETKGAWASDWDVDIEIDGPVEDQQAVRSFLFYLRSAIAERERMSLSPYGLSSPTYNGHVFWDADIWVFPALALIEPEKAKAIPAYRLELRDVARANFDQWMSDGRPHANGKLGNLTLFGKVLGYKFPWESSVTGRETVPGPSKYEEHISGDVAWMLHQAASLDLCPADMAAEIVLGVGSYYGYRSPGGIMTGVMSPDESHIGENDLYTNLLAQWCANGGKWVPEGTTEFGRPRIKFKLPQDDQTFLTYNNDALRSYKQAAAVLSIYPLQYPPAEAQAVKMMDRFADKTTPNGPAMSDSLHALIWARLGETDKAYDTWKRGWQDFVKGPFLLFSEKRKKESTYFTTGAAGCLQTVLYGFLGFRIDSKKQAGAGWSTNLALGQVLSVKPNLPKTWKSVKFKNFTVLGRRYTLIATHPDSNGKGGVQVIQGDH